MLEVFYVPVFLEPKVGECLGPLAAVLNLYLESEALLLSFLEANCLEGEP